MADHTRPPAPSTCSGAARASFTLRLNRAKFQTAIPATTPSSTISIARFHPGPRCVAAGGVQLLNNFEDVQALSTGDGLDLLALEWSEMKVSPSRPPTRETRE